MDIAKLTEGIGLVRGVVETLKNIKDLLPSFPKKESVEKDLLEAERSLKTAEAQIAWELGYEICRCDFPPQIALQQQDGTWKCPKCGLDPVDITVYQALQATAKKPVPVTSPHTRDHDSPSAYKDITVLAQHTISQRSHQR